MNKFICDGCSKEYPIKEAVDVNTPNLAGIVMCKSCTKNTDDDTFTEYAKKYSNNVFKLCTECGEYYSTDSMHIRIANYSGDGLTKLIDLDEEDIAYFKNKYFPQLQNEMNDKINKLRETYTAKITDKQLGT